MRSSPDAFDGYVARTPVAYALFRTAESHALGGLRLSRPVLDVGCGVGDFAAFALSAPVDAGVDLLGDRLALARSRGVYSGLAQTDAAALPLADATFATVISVSVLEHVRRPVEAVTEAFRVLRPGGRFLVTIVLSDLHAYLFYPWVFRRLRMPWL
ncbi:MAG TPA: class I SAM-dependent methyltransferase, partial [Pirellulales bacterium]|nr:class I SAM-dependent methyltransferase [Pirellulales bacterium]